MASDLLGISISGLRYSQTALSTTGHNIANAGVAGYSRQSVNGVTNPATQTGAGFIGNGVSVDAINRMVDEFVTQQTRTDSSLYAGLDAFQTHANRLNGLLADASTGLSGGLASFFAAIQNGSDDPTSIPARQLIVSEAENLADRFNTLHSQFEAIGNSIDGTMEVAVSQINSLTVSIGELNQKISEAFGTGSNPNDLLDQRDETLRQLSELVNIRTLQQSDGQVNVMVGKGQALVIGNQVRQLDIADNAIDPSKSDVVISGRPPQVITSSIDGGELGGLISFRDGPLANAFQEFGRVAVVMADTFNQVHQQGVNLDNTFGGNFFYDVNDADIAAQRVSASARNTGTGQLALNISDSSQIQASDYRITMDGTSYQITRLSDNTVVVTDTLPATMPATVNFDGLELAFDSGSFADGDSFLLQPVTYGARDFTSVISDPEAIAFASPILTDADIGNTGTGRISTGDVSDFDDFSTVPMPLVVRFTADNEYEIIDYSDPANPVALALPPGANFVPGSTNSLFDTTAAPYTGINVSISGAPKAGDTFTIDFNQDAASDNRNGLALVNLEAAATINGVASFAEGYGALVEEIGIQTSSNQINLNAAEHVMNQTLQLRESISGVNLDEEAANLIRFEQMFSANAQVISVARDIFDQLISSL